MQSSRTEAGDKALAECFAGWAARLGAKDIPQRVRQTLARDLLDTGGLMVAARGTDYVAAAVGATEGEGRCTAIGHERAMIAAEAALISGTAAHGEDFDDTFEGSPVHVGAVIVPAVLAAAEGAGRSGSDVLKGLAVGGELMCRLTLVAPTAIHRAGFHPTAVIGAMGAAAGVAAALGLRPQQMASALGIAGSLAAGIIEYLAEGTWTKRLHPGWAAQAGIKAARLAANGFLGPRTVFEGRHGFFFAFADPSIERDFSRIISGLGEHWHVEKLAFKPYACGTMVQPFIDCAVRLRGEGVTPDRIERITASVGEGTVHRLWEPRAEKIAPTTPYSAKFSGHYGIAIGFCDGAAGLAQFTDERIQDPAVLAVAERVHFEIDPRDEYPRNYTGRLRVQLSDGRTMEAFQPHLRGGVREPLSDAEVMAKFEANTAFGGWPAALAQDFARFVDGLFGAADLAGLARFRV